MILLFTFIVSVSAAIEARRIEQVRTRPSFDSKPNIASVAFKMDVQSFGRSNRFSLKDMGGFGKIGNTFFESKKPKLPQDPTSKNSSPKKSNLILDPLLQKLTQTIVRRRKVKDIKERKIIIKKPKSKKNKDLTTINDVQSEAITEGNKVIANTLKRLRDESN